MSVVLSDYMIMPHDYSTSAGAVTFLVRNDGEAPHDFSIRTLGGEVLAATATLNPGQQVVLTKELTAGTYDVFCSVAGHESLGMKGKLTVT